MTEPDPCTEAHELFPIREVVRITGINPVTLRAWERRYGLIQPTRTESGHRLYSQANIDEVRAILGWVERGVAVSKVGQLLARSRRADPGQTQGGQAAFCDFGPWRERVLQAVESFDEQRLEQLYGQLFSSHSLNDVFQTVLLPVWRDLMVNGSRFGQTSQWLFLDTFLRARTLQRLQLAREPGQVRVLLAGMPGQCQELELWVAGLLMGSASVGVWALPVGQPLDELSLVCDKLQPVALVLYSTLPAGADVSRNLSRLALSVDCPVLLAGEMASLIDQGLQGDFIGLGNDGRSMRYLLQQCLDSLSG